MSHKPRFNQPDIPQHIIQYGNSREPCFRSEKDYLHYLDDLKQSAVKYHCQIHAYVLMKNHVQLLVTPMIENGVSLMMQALDRHYVKYFNQAYNRMGSLWEEDYKSSSIDSDIYLLACMCYIEMDPVRANRAVYPDGYRWSSYQGNVQEIDDKLISRHPIYMTLGETDDEKQFVYRELFQRHLDNDVIHQIRDALNYERNLGWSCFKGKIEKVMKRRKRVSVNS